MYLCMYPFSAHSFGPIGMKLGMDTPWDPGSVMGLVASAKRKARGSEATAGLGKVALHRSLRYARSTC